MTITYNFQGDRKHADLKQIAVLKGAELQAAIAAARFLGLERLLPAYLIFKGGKL